MPRAIASRSGPSGSAMPRSLAAALPPTIQRIAGSWRRRSASFTSSYPASRPKTDWRNNPDQCVTSVFASAGVGEQIARHRRQPKCVVEFAIGKQPSIGGHDGTAKLQHQAAVEIEPKSPSIRFTRRVRHDCLAQSTISR